MPTIFIQAKPDAECIITEYCDFVFISEVGRYFAYIYFTIKNIGNSAVDSICVYIPYEESAISKKIVTSANECEKRKFFNHYTEIELKLSPLQIQPEQSLNMDLSYGFRNDNVKSPQGYPLPFSFYNLNYLNSIKDNFPMDSLKLSSIPPIKKKRLKLIAVCSKGYTFCNNDNTPESGVLSCQEDNKTCITNAIERIKPLYFYDEKPKWSEYLMWGHPQLSHISEEVLPDTSGRAVKLFFTKCQTVKIGKLEFSYPDIISLFIGFISLIIAIYSIIN